MRLSYPKSPGHPNEHTLLYTIQGEIQEISWSLRGKYRGDSLGKPCASAQSRSSYAAPYPAATDHREHSVFLKMPILTCVARYELPNAPLTKDGHKHTYTGHPLPDLYLQDTYKFAVKSAIYRTETCHQAAPVLHQDMLLHSQRFLKKCRTLPSAPSRAASARMRFLSCRCAPHAGCPSRRRAKSPKRLQEC